MKTTNQSELFKHAIDNKREIAKHLNEVGRIALMRFITGEVEYEAITTQLQEYRKITLDDKVELLNGTRI